MNTYTINGTELQTLQSIDGYTSGYEDIRAVDLCIDNKRKFLYYIDADSGNILEIWEKDGNL